MTAKQLKALLDAGMTVDQIDELFPNEPHDPDPAPDPDPDPDVNPDALPDPMDEINKKMFNE